MRMTVTICIDAPQEKVWRWLADVEAIETWSDAVIRARCVGSRKQGVGTERVCDLSNGTIIRERWLEWEEGRSFRYEGLGLPFIRRATNVWTLAPEGRDRTLLTSEAEIEFRGVFGRLLSPLFHLIFARTAASAFAPFKFLVENGRPYTGDPRRLPAPAVC